MEKLDQYRKYVQQIIERHAAIRPAFGEIEAQTVFDWAHEHYQLVYAGWNKNRRKYGCLIHMDIKDGKIWIQQDGTEFGVANELVLLGVPKDDIVLAFMPEYKRPYAEYAVA